MRNYLSKIINNKYLYLIVLIIIGVLVFMYGLAYDILEIGNKEILDSSCVIGSIEFTYGEFLSWSYLIGFFCYLFIIIWQLFTFCLCRYFKLRNNNDL